MDVRKLHCMPAIANLTSHRHCVNVEPEVESKVDMT